MPYVIFAAPAAEATRSSFSRASFFPLNSTRHPHTGQSFLPSYLSCGFLSGEQRDPRGPDEGRGLTKRTGRREVKPSEFY
jgi:hypothetical protein